MLLELDIIVYMCVYLIHWLYIILTTTTTTVAFTVSVAFSLQKVLPNSLAYAALLNALWTFCLK